MKRSDLYFVLLESTNYNLQLYVHCFMKKATGRFFRKRYTYLKIEWHIFAPSQRWHVGVAFILLFWDASLTWWDKFLYSNSRDDFIDKIVQNGTAV